MLLFSKICYKIKEEMSAAGNIHPAVEIEELRNHGMRKHLMAHEGIGNIAFKHRYTPATAAPEVYNIIPPPSSRASVVKAGIVIPGYATV